MFFADCVAARDARNLGSAIISRACARTRRLKLESYDRLFPNQDTMPKGGFGNLIALPFQYEPSARGCSVFVDAAWQRYPDQWAHLDSLESMPPDDIAPTVLRATGGVHPLDVTFIDTEDQRQPWKRAPSLVKKLVGSLPKSLVITLSNLVYFEKAQLPQALANRLIRLAAFQNPAYYKAQAMGFSVWNTPRVIGCGDNFPLHIALPRGCLDAAMDLLRGHPMPHACCCPPASWWEKVSIIPRLIPWCWPCRFPGKAPCSNTPGVCIANTPPRPMCIIDFVDSGHPTLLRMWGRRQSGYRAMGYRIAGPERATTSLFYCVAEDPVIARP